MTFNALVVNKIDQEEIRTGVEALSEDRLPDGNVTVVIEFSTVNSKDGLCLQPGGGGLVRHYPHVPGIDFAGTVESQPISSD
jgi:acrylyl-CoA reductase (NADPH)